MQVSDMFLGERVKSEFGFAAVDGLPAPVVSDEGSGHHAASNKQERAHGARRVCCAPASLWHTTCTSNDQRNFCC